MVRKILLSNLIKKRWRWTQERGDCAPRPDNATCKQGERGKLTPIFPLPPDLLLAFVHFFELSVYGVVGCAIIACIGSRIRCLSATLCLLF